MLSKLSFKGGVHPQTYKELTSGSEIVPMPAPDKVEIPLQQHIGIECEPLVKKGDMVKVGQKIGKTSGFMSVAVHSSVSGVVSKIEKIYKSSGHYINTIFIDNDGKDELGYEIIDRDYRDLSKEEILSLIQENGISGMGGAGFPTHVKLSVKEGEVDTIILNGAECEPYLTSDDAMMRKYPEKIIEGLKICMQVTGAKRGYIAIEDNKPKAIESLSKYEEDNIKVCSLITKYPQGDEKRIIDAVTKRRVPDGGLPKDIGVVVVNVSTAAAISDAIKGKPLYERVVTVTGMAVKDPKNILVRFGSPIYECIEFCGGLTEDPCKLIVGGPMMGFAQNDFEKPIEKGVNGIVAMTGQEVNMGPSENCIRCARCADVCPVKLLPMEISSSVAGGDFERAKSFHALSCIECGSCSFTCPSNIPILENIRLWKMEIRKEKLKERK